MCDYILSISAVMWCMATIHHIWEVVAVWWSSQWLEKGKQNPFYEKGENEDLGNYRPVRLTSVPCKIINKILLETVLRHIENKRAALSRRTWEYWLTRSSTCLSRVHLQPRRPTVSCAASKEGWPAGRGRWFCPSALLRWNPTWSIVCTSGALSTGKTWTCLSRSRGRPQKWWEGWNTSPVRTGRESWGYSTCSRQGFKETL